MDLPFSHSLSPCSRPCSCSRPRKMLQGPSTVCCYFEQRGNCDPQSRNDARTGDQTGLVNIGNVVVDAKCVALVDVDACVNAVVIGRGHCITPGGKRRA